MSKFKLCLIAMLAAAATGWAEVSLRFENTLGSVGGSTQTRPQSVTLGFDVDAAGNVTLADTSCGSADVTTEAALALWEGSVGTVGSSYGPTTFSITLTAISGKSLVLGDWGSCGGGFGVTGENQWKIDDSQADAVVVTVSGLDYPNGLKITGLDWSNANTSQDMGAQLDASNGIFTNTITSATGSWTVVDNVLAAGSFSIGNATTNQGYTLQGFSFELADATDVYPKEHITTFNANPGTGSATNIFTVSADGSATTASISGNSMLTEGLLPGATGSFTFTWEPVDQFDSTAVTGRVGTGWAYNGGDDAYGPKTLSNTTIGMGNGDAIIMTVSTNGITLPANQFLRVDNLYIRSDNGSHVVYFYDASEGVSTAITGSDPGQNPTAVGNYVYQTLNQIVEHGDKIAFAQESGGQVRQYGFQFSLAEITDQTGVPQNLTATAVDSAILLDWDDDDTGYPLQEYTVYRSLAPGVTTNDFHTNVTVSTFADTGLINGSNYYYAVSSTGTNGVESALSAEVSATPVPDSGAIVQIQWLDASDGATVTTNASGEMTLWADKTANGNDAVDGPGDPILWPSASLSGSGLAGMDVRTNRANITAFDSVATDAFLDFSGDASTNSGFTALVAFKADFVTQDNTRNIVMGTQENLGGALNGFGLRYDRGVMMAFMNSSGTKTAIRKDGPTDLEVVDGDTIVLAFTYKTANGAMALWDSKNNTVATGTTAPFGNFTSSDPLYLAGSGNGGQYMDGMIGEVQIYSTTLSEAELVSRGEALALKWGAEAGSGFDIWAGGWGVDIGAATNDYDLDGADNLAEYALNGNPTNAADKGQFAVMAGSGMFKYVYASNSADSALTYTFIDTTDLVFQTSPQTNSYASADVGATAGDYTTVTNSYNTTADTLFVELEVEQN